VTPRSSPTRCESPRMLISVSEDGHLQTMDQGMQLLGRCAEPIHLISVCGVAREGKSALCTMLMRLLAEIPMNSPSNIRFSGSYAPMGDAVIGLDDPAAEDPNFCFAIGSGTRACTDGAWIWATPWTTGSIVILDSQGLSKGNTEGVRRLFSSLALCSSVLVMNVMRQLNDDSLSKLNVLSALSTLVKSESHEISNNMEMPALAILLRDMDLDIGESGFADLNSWMEATLAGITGGDAQQVTEAIRNDFPSRQMLAMECPEKKDKQFLKDIAAGKQQGVMREGDFKQSFLKVADVLLQTVKEHPKKLGGELLDGAGMTKLVQRIVDAANGTHVDIQSGAQSIMSGACDTLADKFELQLQTRVHELEALLPKLDYELDSDFTFIKHLVLDGFGKALDETTDRDKIKVDAKSAMFQKVTQRLATTKQNNTMLQIRSLNKVYEKEEIALKKTLQKLYQDREMYDGDFNGYVKAHDAASAKHVEALKEKLESFTRKDLLDEKVDKFKVIIEGHLASNQNDEQAGEEWRPDEETTTTLTPTMQSADLDLADKPSRPPSLAGFHNGIALASSRQGLDGSRRRSEVISREQLAQHERDEEKNCCRCTLL